MTPLENAEAMTMPDADDRMRDEAPGQPAAEPRDAAEGEPEGDDRQDGEEVEEVEEGEAVVSTETEGDLFSKRAFALRLVEAILFASDKPVSEAMLAKKLPEGTDILGLLRSLAEDYAERGVHLQNIAGGWAFRTASDLATSLRSFAIQPRRLSRAAVEALAIIAYHQPVTRAEIEQIRGVALSRGTIEILLEAGWIRPRGKRQTPGRPVTWGTSTDFLDHFGLARIEDLPGVEELKAAGLLDRRASVTTLAMRAEDHAVAEESEEAAAEAEGIEPIAMEDEPEDSDEGEE
jgi:segregation and condensation protein B